MRSCQQRSALLDKYRSATAVYAQVLRQLRGTVGDDYIFVAERVQAARQKMIAAQENLNLHLAKHGCQLSISD
jgi:hypothetical protein